MNNTPNINLSTYTSDPNDKFNLLVTFNNNMSKIDTAVGAQNDAIEVIEETASTAVSTANTASATAGNALTTANSKASIDDLVSSTTTTYSSDKIDDLISGIQPGTEIDDSVTSTTKTWSSSKINTEISGKASINDTTASITTTYSSDKIDDLVDAKASINDTTASATTTYSSNKINDLLDDINPIPYTGNSVTETSISISDYTSEQSGTTSRLTAGYYYLTAFVRTSGTGSLFIHFRNSSHVEILQGEYQEATRTHSCITPIFYVPENGYFNVALHSTSNNFTSLGSVTLHKVN